MKKLFAFLCAAAMIVSVSACKDKKSEHELGSGANIDPNAAQGSEPYVDPDVELDVDVKTLEALVDEADSEYKSFEIVPIESADFFVGKKLHLVSFLKDHNMSFIYDSNIFTTISKEKLTITYNDENDKPVVAMNNIYKLSAPMTTPGGNKYIYAAFGSRALTEDIKDDYNTDCIVQIKMRDDVNMQGHDADTYIMLIESAVPDQYEIFMVEE